MTNDKNPNIHDSQVKSFLSFEQTPLWQKAHELVLSTYQATAGFPKEEQFALTSQLRRSILSVEANIAESFGRYHFLDKINFLYHARGSLEESKSHLRTAHDLGYLQSESYGSLRPSCESLGAEMNRFILMLRRKHSQSIGRESTVSDAIALNTGWD